MRILSIAAALITLLYSCAHPVAPSGGPEDQTPPVLKSVSPENGSMNQRPFLVRFRFDENIQVANPGENVVVSPVSSFKPVFKKGNKTLTVEFPADSLLANTTYSIDLNTAISDLNENNPGKYPVFLFTTGDHLDTGDVQVRFMELESTKNTYMAIAVKKESGSVFYRGAFSEDKASAENRFQFSGMGNGLYDIYIFNDLNKNNRPDKDENIGHSTRSTETNDSSLIYIYGNPVRKTDLNVRGSEVLLTNVVHPLSDLLAGDNKISAFADTLIMDSTYYNEIRAKYFKEHTVARSNYKSGLLHIVSKTILNTDSSGTIHVLFNQNITSIDTSRIFLFGENDTNKMVPIALGFNKNILDIKPLYPFSSYMVKIGQGAVKTTYTELGRVIRESVMYDAMGKVLIENKGSKDVWFKISTEKEQRYFYIPAGIEQVLYLKKGIYKGFYFYDQNGNGWLDPASAKEKTEAETFKFSPQILSDPKMENIISIDIDKA